MGACGQRLRRARAERTPPLLGQERDGRRAQRLNSNREWRRGDDQVRDPVLAQQHRRRDVQRCKRAKLCIGFVYSNELAPLVIEEGVALGPQGLIDDRRHRMEHPIALGFELPSFLAVRGLRVVGPADMRVACGISITTKRDWELSNIEKCLAAGFTP